LSQFNETLSLTARGILKRDLTEDERVEFLDLAGAIGMDNVADYLYMLMIFKRNEDRLDAKIAELAELETRIHDTLERAVDLVLSDGARRFGRELGDEVVSRAEEILTDAKVFWRERGQAVIIGFLSVMAAVFYCVGTLDSGPDLSGGDAFRVVMSLKAGWIALFCCFGYVYFWAAENWRRIRRSWYFKGILIAQTLLLIAFGMFLFGR
jgi:hypothetical protein